MIDKVRRLKRILVSLGTVELLSIFLRLKAREDTGELVEVTMAGNARAVFGSNVCGTARRLLRLLRRECSWKNALRCSGTKQGV